MAGSAERASSALDEAPIDDTPFQITATGMVAPFALVCVFDLAAAACICLLGYPRLALATLIVCTAVNVAFQRLIAHWLRSVPAGESDRSLSKLAIVCLLRNAVLIAPATTMALSGGSAQIAYLGVVSAIGVLLSFASGTLSRKVFWSFATPPLAAMLLLALYDFRGISAIALVIGTLSLTFLLFLVSQKTTEVVQSWQAAFSANRALVDNFREARDQAIAEKEAADRAREEARKASNAKSNFLANMSHELRTPLNAILGFSELLLSDGFAARRVEYSKLIHSSGSHLLNLVNDILDLSKMEVGQISLHEREVDFGESVAICCSLVRSKAQDGRIDLVGEVSSGLTLWADERAVRQILLNLMSNAIKFTPPGGTVTIFAHLDANNVFCFGVRDTGVGIAPSDQERVFENFGQGRHDAVSSEQGTGLGLAIVKGLAIAHGGQVALESALGCGTCVTVSFPATRVLIANAA